MKSTHTQVNRRDRRKAHIMIDEIQNAEHALLNAEYALSKAETLEEYYRQAWKTAKVQQTNAEFITVRLRKRLSTYMWLFWITLIEFVMVLGYMLANGLVV